MAVQLKQGCFGREVNPIEKALLNCGYIARLSILAGGQIVDQQRPL